VQEEQQHRRQKMSAPFRIRRPVSKGALAAATATGEDFNAYLDRLLKMIPAEVISLYLVGGGLIPKEKPVVLVVWAVICLAGLLIIRAYGTADKLRNLPTDWVHVAISTVAFFIWLYSLGGPFEAYGLHVDYLGWLLVLAWTFFVPLFYKGPKS
jgi:hypothetical protein